MFSENEQIVHGIVTLLEILSNSVEKGIGSDLLLDDGRLFRL